MIPQVNAVCSLPGAGGFFIAKNQNEKEYSQMTVELEIIRKNGGAYIDSRQVAEVIGKRHDHLLRDIGMYADILARATHPNFGVSDFFVRASYFDTTGRELLCYLITKKGCEMVANKLIGEKGVLFTAAYVTKFNRMEQAERDIIIANAATPKLRVFNNAVRNVLSGFAQVRSSPVKVMSFLRGAYRPFKINVDEWGTSEKPYSVTEIARRIGIYSNTGRPHGHAAAAIIDRLNIGNEHIECVPFGLVGIMMRYDEFTLNAVADWLEANGYPHDIPYLDFEYHIHYRSEILFVIDGEDCDDGWFNEGEEMDCCTEDELEKMCGDYYDCDDCPGQYECESFLLRD
jgi:Rha family phage regulatory protein